MSSKMVLQAFKKRWVLGVGVGLEWLFVAVNYLAFKELAEAADRRGISRPSAGNVFMFFSFFSLFYTLKRPPRFSGPSRL